MPENFKITKYLNEKREKYNSEIETESKHLIRQE